MQLKKVTAGSLSEDRLRRIHMSVPEHGELIHRVVFQIFQYLSVVCPIQQFFPVTQNLSFRFMLGRPAHTASGAHHAFHEIFFQLSGFEKQHGLDRKSVV